MDRHVTQNAKRHSTAKKTRAATAEDHRCILCEVTIEVAEYEVFFATGRCRFCHETLESEED